MKILFIGLGSIAKKHIHALKDLLECEIYALRSGKNPKIHEGIINVLEIEEVIFKVDFVVLTNPTYLHAEYIGLLSKYGKPLFIEKPPLHTLAEIKNLSEMIGRSGMITYIGCNLRFHPSIVFLKEKIKDKRINEVNIYAGSYLPDWRPGKDFKSIYSAQKEMGGGVHLDLFHEIDYASWIFGMPLTSRTYTSSKSSLNINAVDYANSLWNYEGFNLSIILNYYRKLSKRVIEIVFEDEIWTVDLLKNEIVSDFGKVLLSGEFSILETYRTQMQYFISCIRTNSKPMNDFIESAEKLKICLMPNYETEG
jgi:predicted dehydrogenase